MKERRVTFPTISSILVMMREVSRMKSKYKYKLEIVGRRTEK